MTSSPPLIGISTLRRPVNGLRGSYPAQVVDVHSVAAINAAGGVPLLLPPLPPERAAEQLEPLGALVLSGGDDIGAGLYDGVAHPRSGAADAERDRWELALLTAAGRRGLPVLGICRGAQLINVARGGTLHGHLEGSEAHELDVIGAAERHLVAVEPGTQLASLLGTEPLRVASSHHQGVDLLGSGLRAGAHAADGVIEALESEDGRELGVQWHPEFQLDEPAGQPLFDWVVARAGGRRSPRA
ncbi:MAG TPA: gamma-glutamyl-gamma-aminobutyrate hydrolase family protein [Solirubrobacterales bacterium]|nr:gamma-glutamyl-gamma-aminobutyrate hydrolase family protein [Solirubrobacterales bacterium]